MHRGGVNFFLCVFRKNKGRPLLLSAHEFGVCLSSRCETRTREFGSEF